MPVSAAFAASPLKAKPGEEVLFTLDQAAGVSAVHWDFGDGVTSSELVAHHAYSQPGRYAVSAQAEGAGGHDLVTKNDLIQILREVTLEADFSWAPEKPVVGEPVRLIDLSSGNPSLWLWESAGQLPQNGRSPTITFDAAGPFNVKLTVQREGEGRSTTKTITVLPPPKPLLQAAFRVLPTSGRSPLEVQFDDQSLGQVARYLWDFGDGGTSDLKNPRHTYRAEADIKEFRPRLVIRDSAQQEARDVGSVVIAVMPPIPLWKKLAALALGFILLWVIIVVPVLRHFIGLASVKDSRFVFRPKAGAGRPVYILAGKFGLSALFWPRRSIFVGSSSRCELKILGCPDVVGKITRLPFQRVCVLTPMSSGVGTIYSVKTSTDLLTKAIKTEKAPLVGTTTLRGNDEFEIGGTRYIWSP